MQKTLRGIMLYIDQTLKIPIKELEGLTLGGRIVEPPLGGETIHQ